MMADVLAFYEQRIRPKPDYWEDPSGKNSCTCRPSVLCPRCSNSKRHKFENDFKYGENDDIRPEHVEGLTDWQYFLCPQAVPVYSFKTREWRKKSSSIYNEPS